jgi:CubicO group peptidase (beta-lactamase class C family)
LFLLGDGKAGGEQILPEGWIKEATSPKMVGGSSVDYGYMVWPIPNASGTINEGAFEARGIYGQHVYVNPRESMVIVVWGALPKPTGMTTIVDNDFFAAASRALRAQTSTR